MSELKPCPFCGGTSPLVFPRTCNKDTPYNPADRAFPIVRCSGCYGEAAGSNWSEPATAIAAWNRRTDPLAASHQRLKEALEKLRSSCDDSDDARYGTLSTSFVVSICDAALKDAP